jgi:hypothetical protein
VTAPALRPLLPGPVPGRMSCMKGGQGRGGSGIQSRVSIQARVAVLPSFISFSTNRSPTRRSDRHDRTPAIIVAIAIIDAGEGIGMGAGIQVLARESGSRCDGAQRQGLPRVTEVLSEFVDEMQGVGSNLAEASVRFCCNHTEQDTAQKLQGRSGDTHPPGLLVAHRLRQDARQTLEFPDQLLRLGDGVLAPSRGEPRSLLQQLVGGGNEGLGRNAAMAQGCEQVGHDRYLQTLPLLHLRVEIAQPRPHLLIVTESGERLAAFPARLDQRVLLLALIRADGGDVQMVVDLHEGVRDVADVNRRRAGQHLPSPSASPRSARVVAISPAGLVEGMGLVIDGANCVAQGGLLVHELDTDWWRLDRTVQRLTSNISGWRGTAAAEVVWSCRPLAHQARLLDPRAVFGR